MHEVTIRLSYKITHTHRNSYTHAHTKKTHKKTHKKHTDTHTHTPHIHDIWDGLKNRYIILMSTQNIKNSNQVIDKKKVRFHWINV